MIISQAHGPQLPSVLKSAIRPDSYVSRAFLPGASDIRTVGGLATKSTKSRLLGQVACSQLSLSGKAILQQLTQLTPNPPDCGPWIRKHQIDRTGGFALPKNHRRKEPPQPGASKIDERMLPDRRVHAWIHRRARMPSKGYQASSEPDDAKDDGNVEQGLRWS
jgi:hypothetical protein